MNERYTMLSALKGPALKCLIAFCWENRQLTVTELCMYVGHDDQTLRAAMRQLELYGLAAQVISSQETWHLTDKGYQLPLPINQLAPSPEERISPQERNSLLRRNSPLLTTTTRFYAKDSSVDELSSSSNAPAGENFSPPAAPPESPIDAEVSGNLSELHKIGIMGRKAVEIARCEWVDPEYIRGSHARWQAEGYTQKDLGLLIKFMLDGDPAPAKCEECQAYGGHHADCQSFGDLAVLAELVATGEVKAIKKPSPALVQAMMRYNQDRLTINY